MRSINSRKQILIKTKKHFLEKHFTYKEFLSFHIWKHIRFLLHNKYKIKFNISHVVKLVGNVS